MCIKGGDMPMNADKRATMCPCLYARGWVRLSTAAAHGWHTTYFVVWRGYSVGSLERVRHLV